MKLHALRLQPGDDLHLALEEFTQKSGISAGFIAGAVGSLLRARLRFSDAGVPNLVGGPLEILSLSGTLSPDGAHLHLSAANARGGVLGGYVMSGCIIHTTAEVVIGEATALSFRREPDAKTGYRELVVSPRPD
ncbi:MAG: DNA-binding protein [Betaproteobacteria bacterium]|nr:DNA-binding protein [Betaproteobacteria bacterium]